MSSQQLPPVAFSKAMKHRDPRWKGSKTPLSFTFDIDHVCQVLASRGLDPFDKLAKLAMNEQLEADDARLVAGVLQYLADHVKAKPKQIEINATVRTDLATVLAGLGEGKNS